MESALVFPTSTSSMEFAPTVSHQTSMTLNSPSADLLVDKISNWTLQVLLVTVLEDSEIFMEIAVDAQLTQSTTDIKRDATVLSDILSAQDSVSPKLPLPKKPLHFLIQDVSVRISMLSNSMDNASASLATT